MPEATIQGFFDGPPDLAVEVLSPDDRPGKVAAKVEDWLTSGCSAVWLVDPAKKTVAVHRREVPTRVLSVSDDLDGEDVLPGFRIPVAEVFAR